MPTGSVFSIDPVYTIVSSDPSVSGPGGADDLASDSGGDGGPNATVVFSKASYGTGSHGGPVPSYPAAVTLPATVTPRGTPAVLLEGGANEQRPLSTMLFDVSTDVDPGVELGAPLVTDDLMQWAGFDLFVVGTAIPLGTGYLTTGRLTT